MEVILLYLMEPTIWHDVSRVCQFFTRPVKCVYGRLVPVSGRLRKRTFRFIGKHAN
jgi:hypothetical protein